MGDTPRILGAPALYVQGPDASSRIGDIAAGLGRNVLFVSDAAVERLFAPRVRQSIEASGLAFSSVSFTGDLTPASVERMACAQRAWQPEVVIAAGGGKGVDAGKAVACALGVSQLPKKRPVWARTRFRCTRKDEVGVRNAE